MKYIVISVGCLECSYEKSTNPEIILKTNNLSEAQEAARNIQYPGQEDRILINAVTGVILKVA